MNGFLHKPEPIKIKSFQLGELKRFIYTPFKLQNSAYNTTWNLNDSLNSMKPTKV